METNERLSVTLNGSLAMCARIGALEREVAQWADRQVSVEQELAELQKRLATLESVVMDLEIVVTEELLQSLARPVEVTEELLAEWESEQRPASSLGTGSVPSRPGSGGRRRGTGDRGQEAGDRGQETVS